MTGRILVWDLVDWELLDVLEGVHSTETSKVAFIPSSRLALSSAESGSLILWNLDTAEPVADFQVHTEWARGFALSPDGRRALSRSWEEGTLILWDLFGADEIGRFEGHTAAVSGLDFAPDGQHLFSSAGLNNLEPFLEEEYTLRLWDLETGEQTGVVEVRPEHEGAGWVYAALSPDGRTALTGGTDNLVRLWDLETGEEVRRLEGHTDWVWGSAISPDGRQALTGAYYRDPTLILWDLESGEIVDRLNATDGAEDVTFSPDGRNALTCHPYDQTLILWDLESGEQVRRFVGHEGELSSVDFTPDGRRAVSGGWDGALILWDVATGQEIRRLTTPEVWIHETKVTPDGRYALAGFSDGTLIMWDLESGEVARQLYGHLGGIHAIAISPDGRTAASGGEDFTIIHWRLTTPELDELRDWVEASRYVRELTCEERKTYQIEPLCVAEVAEREATPEPATGGMKAPERTKHTAQVGENRGEIVLGDFDIWLYEGQAGENLTLRLIADNPANYTTQEQRLELGLLDAYLVVIAPDGSLMASNDDAEAEEFTTDSAIEGLELPEDGIYRIEARSYADLTEGAYTLVIELVESPGE
jgi:WD40 repeat protein